MKNILLTSTGFSHDAVRDYAQKMLRHCNVKSCAIITTASSLKEKNEWAQVAKTQLKEMGVEDVAFIDLEVQSAKLLGSYDLIYVNGGNTFSLLHAFNKLNCKDVVLSHLKSGKPYIGVSAGSCVLGSDIIHLETIGMDENAVGLKNTQGYNLINKKIIPHFRNEHLEYLNSYDEGDYLLLKDGEAAAFEMGETELMKI